MISETEFLPRVTYSCLTKIIFQLNKSLTSQKKTVRKSFFQFILAVFTLDT